MELPLIQLKNTYKKFGDNYVLNGVDLSIYQGQITTIIGKSGTGKSVLLKHLIGLIEPDAGQILFRGKSVAEMKPPERKAWKKKFSYMFQGSALFDSMNVFENIALPLKEGNSLPDPEIERRVRDKMHQLDLYKIDEKYPSQLSGGMQKRVALARALVTEPEIVLFDEPTTGLDPIRKNAVHGMISNYQKRFRFTGVIVSHEIPDIFFISQRIAMLEDGRILFEGTPEEIQMVNDPVVRSFIEGMENPHDDLTGLTSQTQGERRFRQEMSRLQRHQIPFTVVLLKVENIEDVDQIVGHMATQSALKSFASQVQQNIYITDTCFRYGLDKLIVVLPDTDRDQAHQFCQKLSRTLRPKDIDWINGKQPGFCLTVVAGFAEARKDSRFEDLLTRAEASQQTIGQFNV
ncbi:MAG: ATP-binding cassette domain-containing protein, partial [Desulfobacterales bacterium]